MVGNQGSVLANLQPIRQKEGRLVPPI